MLSQGATKFLERQAATQAQREKYSNVHRANRQRVLHAQRAHGFKYQGAGSNDQNHAYHQNAVGVGIQDVQAALQDGDVRSMRRITQLYLMYVLTEDERALQMDA